MKKGFLYLLLLLFPFLGMVLVNESMRVGLEQAHQRNGMKTINTSNKIISQCSWACHDDTNYCKTKHVKWLNNHFQYTDPLYFGIIGLLQSTRTYALANILILVLFIPALLFFFIVQSIEMQFKIRTLNANK